MVEMSSKMDASREDESDSGAAAGLTIKEAGRGRAGQGRAGQFDDNTLPPGVHVRQEGLARRGGGPNPVKCRGAKVAACK